MKALYGLSTGRMGYPRPVIVSEDCMSQTTLSTTHHSHPSSSLEQANFHHLVMDIAWFGFAMASTTRFFQFFAIRMGADAVALGWLAALPALILLITTGFSQWWRNRYPDSVKAVWLPSIGFRFIYLLPAFTPLFPPEYRVLWLVVSAVAPAFAQGIASTVFMVMMRETVSPQQLSALFARRQIAMNITVMIGAVAFGFLLEIVPYPLNYQLMFVFAFLASLISQWHLGKINLLPELEQKPIAKQANLRELFKTVEFQSVVWITLLVYIGFFSIFAIIPLFLERHLGATEGYIALYGVVELVASVLISLRLDKLIKHFGNRNIIVSGMMGTALAALVIGLAPNLQIALLGAALTGAAWAAAGIGILGFFAERTQASDMSVTIIFHQMIFGGMFIGPLIGSNIAGLGLPLEGVVLGGGVLRLVIAVLVIRGLTVFGKAKVRPIR